MQAGPVPSSHSHLHPGAVPTPATPNPAPPADQRGGGEEAGEHHGGGQPDQEQAAAGRGRAAPRAGAGVGTRRCTLLAGCSGRLSLCRVHGRPVSLAACLPRLCPRRSGLHLCANSSLLATCCCARWSWRRRSSNCRPSAVGWQRRSCHAPAACWLRTPARLLASPRSQAQPAPCLCHRPAAGECEALDGELKEAKASLAELQVGRWCGWVAGWGSSRPPVLHTLQLLRSMHRTSLPAAGRARRAGGPAGHG